MIGDKIRELREEKDIKQKDLASFLGISPSTVGMYEQNRRTPDSEMILKLANFFNVTTEYILGRSNLRTPSTETVKEQKLSPEVETIAAHLEEKAKNITPHKMKMLKRYIDDLFDEEFED